MPRMLSSKQTPILPALLAPVPLHDRACSCLQLRSNCLHRVAALAQERIYSADQKEYFLNLILLLFSGADACDNLLRDKVRIVRIYSRITMQGSQCRPQKSSPHVLRMAQMEPAQWHAVAVRAAQASWMSPEWLCTGAATPVNPQAQAQALSQPCVGWCLHTDGARGSAGGQGPAHQGAGGQAEGGGGDAGRGACMLACTHMYTCLSTVACMHATMHLASLCVVLQAALGLNQRKA